MKAVHVCMERFMETNGSKYRVMVTGFDNEASFNTITQAEARLKLIKRKHGW